MHTWAAGLKEQLIKIEINMKATSKESLNAKVIDGIKDYIDYRSEQSNKSLCTQVQSNKE